MSPLIYCPWLSPSNCVFVLQTSRSIFCFYFQFFFYFFLALPSMLLCLSSIAMSSLATAACWGRRCGPDSPALLALGCLGVICSVAMTTMCVMVIMFFLKFKRAFGLLTDEDRVREMQFRGKMLTKQQSGTSQMSVQSI